MLEGSSQARRLTPASRFDDNWSIKDVIAHLWGWQQISIVRVEAAVANREPVYPKWTSALAEDWEENVNQTNAWIYETQHTNSWSEMYQKWKEGYLKLLDSTKRGLFNTRVTYCQL